MQICLFCFSVLKQTIRMRLSGFGETAPAFCFCLLFTSFVFFVTNVATDERSEN